MSLAEPQGVIIACPHCGTRYQLPPDAIGKGRLVQCASCKKSWQASPSPLPPDPPVAPSQPEMPPAPQDDQMFDPADEEELDAAFDAEQRAIAPSQRVPHRENTVAMAEPPAADKPVDPKVQLKREKAFSRRQRSLSRRLPMGRLRRVARMASLVVLMVIIGSGIAFRTEIVRQVPDLAGVYEVLGLGVNVIGLEFRDVHTIRALKDGAEVMTVDARIVSISNRLVVVPPVVVALLDGDGKAIYEWSVTPGARDLEPGEAVPFETTLKSAPPKAERVRLTFTNGRSQMETPIAIGAPQPKAETAH